jgi:asparagine synthase (glutamine-hydrolysing)
VFRNNFKLDLFTDDFKRQLRGINSLNYMFQYFDAENAEHVTDRMLYSDVMTYLPEDLLVKVDRMTMAHGLEGRSPFLDHKLMEFVATIPPQDKLRGTRLKYILKQLGKAWLPDQILRREKKGFSVPIGKWFRHELRDMISDLFASSSLVKEGIFNDVTLQRMLSEHQSGKMDHKHRIWLLLNFELWYRMFIRNA